MLRLPVRSAALLILLLAVRGPAAEPPLVTALGRVVKANANVVILRPVVAGGRLGDAVALKVSGTSRVTIASTQKRDGEAVVVQRTAAAADLRPDQIIAVVYTAVGPDRVLLTAVAQSGSGR